MRLRMQSAAGNAAGEECVRGVGHFAKKTSQGQVLQPGAARGTLATVKAGSLGYKRGKPSSKKRRRKKGRKKGEGDGEGEGKFRRTYHNQVIVQVRCDNIKQIKQIAILRKGREV